MARRDPRDFEEDERLQKEIPDYTFPVRAAVEEKGTAAIYFAKLLQMIDATVLQMEHAP